MTAAPDRSLAAAHAALAAGEWAAARRAFEAVLDDDPSAEALAGLGDALWWLGETDAAVHCQEEAYAAFRRRSDPVPSALTAISLSLLQRISLGNSAAARGWLARAARIVDEHELAPLVGWVLLIRAHGSDDPEAAARWAQEAHTLAGRFSDADLELCALSQLGAALVQVGRTSEGAALLEEAMVGALAGEGDRLHTVVYTSCNMISACSETAEVGRAVEWIRAADGFTRRYGCPHLYTHCRTYYGAILFATGDWVGAEHELETALAMAVHAEPALYAEALARLAELRLAQGRVEEVARLLEGYEDHAASACVCAQLAVARGEPDVAEQLLRRRLRELDEQVRPRPGSYRAGMAVCLETAALLELQAGLGDGVDALAVVRRLAGLGQQSGCELVVARAERAQGVVLAEPEHLERALSAFTRLGMPLEAARTRLTLARLIEGAPAVAEARAALAGFEGLGAANDADAAAARLRELGTRVARGGSGDADVLTRREREVLELLAEGLSNRELADRLFLARKTVEHHVRNVLAKLGLRNRAQAAAWATRHPPEDRPPPRVDRATDRGS